MWSVHCEVAYVKISFNNFGLSCRLRGTCIAETYLVSTESIPGKRSIHDETATLPAPIIQNYAVLISRCVLVAKEISTKRFSQEYFRLSHTMISHHTAGLPTWTSSLIRVNIKIQKNAEEVRQLQDLFAHWMECRSCYIPKRRGAVENRRAREHLCLSTAADGCGCMARLRYRKRQVNVIPRSSAPVYVIIHVAIYYGLPFEALLHLWDVNSMVKRLSGYISCSFRV